MLSSEMLTDHLTIDYYPGLVAVSGLVTDGATNFDWLETVKMIGYYCDDIDCPEDDAEECPIHYPGYWQETMRQAWLDNITARGMRPVIEMEID